MPHVTAILEAVGVALDFNALRGFRGGGMAAAIDLAAERGTAVHADCHAYDDDDLLWDTVDVRVRPYVEAWARVRSDKRLTPIVHARERRIYHPTFNYTGILDGVFMADERRVLVDTKTGDPESAAAHLQTAAYAAAWEAEHPDQPIHARWAVWLRPDRRVPYLIFDYTSSDRADWYMDETKWHACLTVYNEQPSRRRRAA